jgi:hypothetical protein
VVVCSLHRIVAAGAVGTQTSVARLEQLVQYVGGLNCTVTTITRMASKAALPYRLMALGPYGTYAANAADLTMIDADVLKVDRFEATGRDLVLVHNTGALAASVSVWSAPDPTLGRYGDVENYELAAGVYAVLGPFTVPGWRQSDGCVYLVASNAAVKMQVIALPAI